MVTRYGRWGRCRRLHESDPRPGPLEEPLVPVSRFRAIVERWIAQFENREQGYQHLAANSGVGADAWRARLTDKVKRSRGQITRGWFVFLELDMADVDEFLAAAGLTELWHTELADIYQADAA